MLHRITDTLLVLRLFGILDRYISKSPPPLPINHACSRFHNDDIRVCLPPREAWRI